MFILEWWHIGMMSKLYQNDWSIDLPIELGIPLVLDQNLKSRNPGGNTRLFHAGDLRFPFPIKNNRCFFHTEIVFKETNWSSVTLWRNWVSRPNGGGQTVIFDDQTAGRQVGHCSCKSMEWKKMLFFFGFGWNILKGCRTLQVRILISRKDFCKTFCFANYDSLLEILDIIWWMFVWERFQKTQRNCALLSSHLGIKWLTGFDGYQF